MDDDTSLFEAFAELLHEVPEAETPLRAWRDAEAKRAVKVAVERRRKEELEDAYVALFALRRTANPH